MELYGYFASSAAAGAAVVAGGSSGILPPPGMRFDSTSSYFKNHPSTTSASSSTANTANNDSNNNTTTILASNRKNEYLRAVGTLSSINTLESFKNMNKNTYLNECSLPRLLKCCGILKINGDGGGDGEEEFDNPNAHLIATTCILHTNLKSNIVVYWFAFPALVPRPGCGIAYSTATTSTTMDQEVSGGRKRKYQRRLIDAWGAHACRMLSNSFYNFRVRHERKELLRRQRGDDGVPTASAAATAAAASEDVVVDKQEEVWCPPFFLLLPPPIDDDDDWRMTGGGRESVKCLPLNEATYNSLSEKEKQDVIFAFVDPAATPPRLSASDADDENAPEAVGWTLRNLVAYVSLRLKLGGTDQTFLSYRCPFLRRIDLSSFGNSIMEDAEKNEEDSMRESFEDVGDDNDDAGVGGSLLLDIAIPLAADYKWPSTSATGTDTNDDDCDTIISSYRCVGWELNKNNKPGPRSIDLRPLVSPAHLSRQANDLNLRLMKWRALPSLNVEMLSNMKVLLIGAGTLGCGVARTLLGWGVRKITFVDSGRVSYSNPVRQSLFCVDDCKDGGKYKATAAAASLVSIAGPDVKSEGVVLSIPMPGHSFGRGKDGGMAEIEAVRKDVERLHSLIDESDVVFLLTDTRESRWLPTVIALATETPLINAALGLDSWLVMRHGPPTSSLLSMNSTTNAGTADRQRLGCYFCSDVVAPENSMRDRTLDQQCTVTRPGLAPIAASMATELMVAMFHHPLGHCAPAPERRRDNNPGEYAPVDDGTDPSSSALGRLPHQIRGTVVTYTMMTPTIPAFQSCTACSDRVVEEYRRNGFDFVKCVCCDDDGSYLEEVSGLAIFREEAAKKLDECLDWDDGDEDC